MIKILRASVFLAFALSIVGCEDQPWKREYIHTDVVSISRISADKYSVTSLDRETSQIRIEEILEKRYVLGASNRLEFKIFADVPVGRKIWYLRVVEYNGWDTVTDTVMFHVHSVADIK